MAFVSLKSQKVHHRIVPLNISVADSPYALSSPQIPIPYPKNEKAPADAEAKNMVGEEGFEPPTLWSQTRCATKLRYSPNIGSYTLHNEGVSYLFLGFKQAFFNNFSHFIT